MSLNYHANKMIENLNENQIMRFSVCDNVSGP